MDKRKLVATIDNISNNVSLIKEILNTGDKALLSNPKRIERAKYFFVSATQSLLNLCNDYIDNKDWRQPINAMDVFIVLAENDVIPNEAVPDLKKAVVSISTLGRGPHNESIGLMRDCLRGIEHCIAGYKVMIQTGEL